MMLEKGKDVFKMPSTLPAMHMMIGNVGSGKSEMAKHLAKKFNAVIVNMDGIQESMHGFYGGYRQDIKSLYQKVENDIIEGALESGVSVVVDRTNMDRKTRKRFVDIARKYRVEIHAYEMPSLFEEDIEIRMKNHRNISRNKWISIMAELQSRFESPELDEGFSSVKHVTDRFCFKAYDFDGTIVEDMFPEIGNPVEEVVRHMRGFWNESIYNRIIIWSCRAGDYQSEMMEWLNKNKVPYDYVNENPMVEFGGRKIFANMYIDDRNICIKDILDTK